MTPSEKIALLAEIMPGIWPDAKSELLFDSPFQLLIATILAAQSTDRQVNIITRELFSIAPDAQRMSVMELETIKKYVRTINYFNNKAKNIHAVSRIIAEEYGGEVPRERSQLEALPGVGRKTANVVLANAFGEAVMAVDTHVHRVSNRIGLVSTKDVLQTETELMKIIPEPLVNTFHHYLLLHGRYTCKARNPACDNCPLRSLCDHAA